MPDEHYLNPRLAALYDLNSGWSPDRSFYLELAGPSPRPAAGPEPHLRSDVGRGAAGGQSTGDSGDGTERKPLRILDLGCGTGLIADAYAARGHQVTGVDPAAAMLDMARQKPHGGEIEWVHASAQDFQSDARFDLIIMTGHAFQVLLDDADVAQTFAMVRRQLAPDGRFVFESRNPAIDWGRRWRFEREELAADGATVVYTVQALSRQGEFLSFEARYEFPDETLVSLSTLRFMPRAAIEAQLSAAGLRAESVLGDWDGTPFGGTEDEMIFMVRRA
jgi:SAM-dependent methyltransferase